MSIGTSTGCGLLAGLALSLSAGCGSADSAIPLVGTSWQLLSIESMAPDEQPGTTIDDPTKYTVTFGEDGRAAFRVDCNRGSSSWRSDATMGDSGSLTLGPIALTRMLCPQPSVDARVAAALDAVRSYLLSDGQLHLSLEADGGIMHWQPAQTAG